MLQLACFDAISAFLLIPLCALAVAHDEASPAEKRGPEPQQVSVVAIHELAVEGGRIAYRSVAETTPLLDDLGKVEAEFFSISYLAETPEPNTRPITFAFNGGPGSASVWLHMGLLGPKRVLVPSDAAGAGAPPYPLVDNPRSLLAASDLVFVDPIGTGYSRVVLDGKNADHWGVDEDARSVARFIRSYLANHKRWASPKYVLGESYGGIRAPLLVRELQGGMNAVALNGVILISPALDMELVDGQENDAALATVVPTYAATAWYHEVLSQRPATLEDLLVEVRGWVSEEYVPALFAGRDLSPESRKAIVASLSRYTGISPEYIERSNLKISTDRFRRELLRDRGLVVGRLDTRYTGREPDAVGEVPSGDPMGSGISGAYVSGFMSYLQGELGVVLERDYKVMNETAGGSWKRPKESWAAFQGYLDVAPDLARGMAENPDLRVFIGNGYYDIATSFFAAEYNLRRSTMDRERVVLRNYPAGHMMYVHEPSFVALAQDLLAFYASASKTADAGN